MRRVLAAVLTLFAATPALAQADWKAPPPNWEGVWAGTIGTLPVHLCLDTTPYRQHGAYYYDRHRTLIRLEMSEDRKAWIEKSPDDRAGPSWHVAAQGKDALAGNWTNGKTSLPIRMRRIGGPSADYEGPCGSMEFHRPRLGPIATPQKSAVKDGGRVTTWTFKPGRPFDNVEITTFTLERPGAAVARVNALLRAVLPEAAGGGEWLDCMEGSANAQGTEGSFYEEIKPTLVSPHWLGATQTSHSDCGGAHPNDYVSYRTFDLQQGIEVDPRDWFVPRAVKVEGVEPDQLKTLTPAFRAALLAGYRPEEKECEAVMSDQDYWVVGVARGALVFQPQLPRVVLACGEEISMSFTRLAPWLNARGKAVVASLPR